MIVRANSHFSGAGLMNLGLSRAGIEIQQSFEIDPACVATARRNFAHEIVEGDIILKEVVA